MNLRFKRRISCDIFVLIFMCSSPILAKNENPHWKNLKNKRKKKKKKIGKKEKNEHFLSFLKDNYSLYCKCILGKIILKKRNFLAYHCSIFLHLFSISLFLRKFVNDVKDTFNGPEICKHSNMFIEEEKFFECILLLREDIWNFLNKDRNIWV